MACTYLEHLVRIFAQVPVLPTLPSHMAVLQIAALEKRIWGLESGKVDNGNPCCGMSLDFNSNQS